MKLLLLGAIGRLGAHILEKLVRADHEVHTLVRDRSKVTIQSPNLQVFEGDLTNIADLRKALAGCDYVIGALNISRTSDWPWASLRTPKTLLSDTMRNLVSLAQEVGLKKIVISSADMCFYRISDGRIGGRGFHWRADVSAVAQRAGVSAGILYH